MYLEKKEKKERHKTEITFMSWNISVLKIYTRVNSQEIVLTSVTKIGKYTDTQRFISSFSSSKECLKIGIVVRASKLLALLWSTSKGQLNDNSVSKQQYLLLSGFGKIGQFVYSNK